MYLGLGVNIIGALLLAYFAIRYYLDTRKAKNMSISMAVHREGWSYKRKISIVLIMLGYLIMMAGAIFG